MQHGMSKHGAGSARGGNGHGRAVVEHTRAPIGRQPGANAASRADARYRPHSTAVRLCVHSQVMDDLAHTDVPTLLATLRGHDARARDRATAALWELWYDEKGTHARRWLEHGTTLLSVDRAGAALSVFERLVANHPDFAEAHNKKATALFVLRRHVEARDACHETLRLNPTHFGAWHGLGLCEMELGHYRAAASAFGRALEIQPHLRRNRELLDRCQTRIH